MRKLVRSLAPLALVCLAPAASPAPQDGGIDLAPDFVCAADADRLAGVSALEWREFLDSLGADADGGIDRETLTTRVLSWMLDADGDGRVTGSDVEARLALLDGNGDGVLSADEMVPGFGRDWLTRMGGAIVAAAGDTNADGQLSANERAELLDGIGPSDVVPDATLVDWARAARDRVSQDRGAFTPGVFLLTLDSAYDADGNGQVEVADLEATFERLDITKDGSVSLDELAAARGRRGRQAWRTGAGDPLERTEPTAAGPPLVPWQRHLDDALAVSRRTGKPLLICVNMDGEAASESLALRRYRDPAFVELMQGFVPLLASPDHHVSLNRTDAGRRLECPRFGRVLCSEHVDIEPIVFDRYFEGRRVAPRHVGVAPDGTILFDLFLLQDLGEIDAALRQHGRPDAGSGTEAALAEPALLDSPDAEQRQLLEHRFAAADVAERARLTGLALSSERSTQQLELLRMALKDEAEEVRRQAVATISREIALTPFDLLPAAFRLTEDDDAARAPLLAAVGQLAEASMDEEVRKRAGRLFQTFTGLQARSAILDVGAWAFEISWAQPTTEDIPTEEELDPVLQRLDELDQLLLETPDDPAVNLAFAATTMRFAQQQMALNRYPSFLLQDVLRGAEKAAAVENPDPRALAYVAWSAHLLNSPALAAETAAAAAPVMTPWAGTPLGLHLLEVIADSRKNAIYGAWSRDTEWETEYVTDARAAHETIMIHPLVTAKHVFDYLDLLGALEAWGPRERVLRRELVNFPLEGRLHAYLRGQKLDHEGADALEAAYAEIPFPEEEGASIDWYRGLATLMAAERHVQEGELEVALGAYARSVEYFRTSTDVEPGFQGSASHYVCLALAGTARVHADEGRWSSAIDALAAGVEANPTSITIPDGLGNTPRENAEHLYTELRRAGRTDEAQNLKVALAERGVKLGG